MEELELQQENKDYRLIEKILFYLHNHPTSQPNLEVIASKAGYSSSYLHRVFKRWVGITPKQFLDLITVDYAKKLLQENRSLLHVASEVGLTSPSRLHDLFVKVEGMTPGEYKLKGQNISIEYGFHATPFGECFMAVTNRGICAFSFVSSDPEWAARQIENLSHDWPLSRINPNQAKIHDVVLNIFSTAPRSQALFIKGSTFQLKVWQALLTIPSGAIVSYADVAHFIHAPKSSRAVGTALSQNPIAYLIPCHRVIKKMGDFGQYHWGTERKKAMFIWEQVKSKKGTKNA